MKQYRLTELSNSSNEWWIYFMNSRYAHSKVNNLLDKNATYDLIMETMYELYLMGRNEVKGGRCPNRMMTFLHMAQSMDRLGDVRKEVFDLIILRGDAKLIGKADVKPATNQQEIPMEFTTVHYINGTPVDEVTDEQLIKYIRDEKKSKESLSALGVESSAVGSKIAAHTDNIKRLVRILDHRAAVASAGE